MEVQSPLNIIFINVDEDISKTLLKVLEDYFEEKNVITERLSYYVKAKNDDHPCLGVVQNGEPLYFNDIYFDFGKSGKDNLLKFVSDKIDKLKVLPDWVINNFLLKSIKFRIFIILPPSIDSSLEGFFPNVISAQLREYSLLEFYVFQRKRKDIRRTLQKVFYKKEEISKDKFAPVNN